MHVQRLTLTNFRSFPALDLPFDPYLTLLFGENGSGKSTIVDALAFALAYLPMSDDRGPRHADLRLLPTGSGSQWVREQATSCTLASETDLGGQPLRNGWRLDKGSKPRPDANMKATRDLLVARSEEAGSVLPVVAVYKAHRRWQDVKRPVEIQAGRLTGYAGCLDAGADLSSLRAWWQQADHQREKGHLIPALDAAERAVASLFGDSAPPPAYDPSDDVDDIVVYIPMVDNRLPLGQLSDGHRSLVALVTDLARRAATLNPLTGAGVMNTPGVVVIDEIDLHLHPTLQREVLPNLRKIFPAFQWVVTTHSPQVLASVEHNHEVIRLDRAGSFTTNLPIAGRDTNAILEGPMEASTRSPEGQARLDPIHAALERGDLAAAEALLDDLEEDWGPLDPEIVEARARVAWAR